MSDLLALAFAEYKRREALKKDIFFPQQDKFVADSGQFIAAITTRRAGKTSALARKFKKTMDRYPNSLNRYIALTRDSAKDIMWPVLQEMDEMHGWNAVFTESNLTMTLPNGARLKLLGADMKNFIKRLKGAKSPAVAIDEAQDFGDHLATLIDDVLTPTLADYEDSWLAVTGTPGPIPRGTFHDITEGGEGGYSIHRWSLFDNPYLPNAKQFVDALKAKKKWDEKNPTYLREYRGIWVLDLDSLLIRYDEKLNDYNSMPNLNWNYITGVDLGINDADALATLAWSEQCEEIYLVEEEINSGDAVSELAVRLKKNMKTYDPQKMPTDEGALGKKIAEELRRRFQIPLTPAEKSRKMENVKLLNDYLRRGLFKARKESQFVSDSYRVQIDHERTTHDRIVVKKGFHSDIIDAVLYGFKESPAFTYEKPKKVPKPDTKEHADMQAEALFQHVKDNLQREKDKREGQGINWSTDHNMVPEWNKW